MSYDIWLEVDTGGEEPASLDYHWDPTYNYGGMFEEAFGRIREFDGLPASDVEEPLRRGIADMEARPDHYRTFDAPNGWGTYGDGILNVLKEWADACGEHPKATVRVT